MTESKQGGQEYEFLHGKARWAKLFTPSTYNKYTLDLNLDQESLGKILELKKRGIKNTVKKNEDGYWVTIASPSKIDTKTGPKLMQPPAVVGKDGSPWNPETGIGNDTEVGVKVHVRKYKNPNNQKDEVAIRLVGVQIHELVPFNPKADFTDDRMRVKADGLVEHKPKPWTT